MVQGSEKFKLVCSISFLLKNLLNLLATNKIILMFSNFSKCTVVNKLTRIDSALSIAIKFISGF